MLPCRQALVYSLILIINVSLIKTSTKFNIVLTTPGKNSGPTTEPHKSVHVKYNLPNDNDQWTIIGFEPQIQVHQKAIEQLTVHLCNSIVLQSIWYDDETVCDHSPSMVLYQWIPFSSLTPFHIPADSGFVFNKSQSIVLTVKYKTEKRVHKEQSGVLMYISTQPPRFRMSTIFVGNQHGGTHFSCRSSNNPRVLYGIKNLSPQKTDAWWRISIIRNRYFGRKLIQTVFDSELLSNTDHSSMGIISSEIFFMDEDYLLIECEDKADKNCYFLIYYTHKSKLFKHDNICQKDEYPNLFKLLPIKETIKTNQTTINTSNIHGSTIFLIVSLFLLFIWISIIIGCIIMRRIRGLVNYRTEPSSPFASQKNKYLGGGGRGHDNFHHRTGDADHIMQVDGEHAGHIS